MKSDEALLLLVLALIERFSRFGHQPSSLQRMRVVRPAMTTAYYLLIRYTGSPEGGATNEY